MRLPRRILACTDFSVGGNEAVGYAIELAAALRAEVVVAHLFDGFVMMPRELLKPPDEAQEEARRVARMQKLQELTRRLSRRTVSIRCLCMHGDPRTEIPRLARREAADLIVVGRYGQSGIDHLFMGSVTDAVVRNANLPVLAVGDGASLGASARPEVELEREPEERRP